VTPSCRITSRPQLVQQYVSLLLLFVSRFFALLSALQCDDLTANRRDLSVANRVRRRATPTVCIDYCLLVLPLCVLSGRGSAARWAVARVQRWVHDHEARNITYLHTKTSRYPFPVQLISHTRSRIATVVRGLYMGPLVRGRRGQQLTFIHSYHTRMQLFTSHNSTCMLMLVHVVASRIRMRNHVNR
jgi:hypothetical protein